MMEIRTNAGDIMTAKELLIKARCDINSVRSIKALRGILDEFQVKYEAITFEAKKCKIEESEFERMDKTKPLEVAYLSFQDSIRPQPSKTSPEDFFRNPRE